jgi:hypothetical protein
VLQLYRIVTNVEQVRLIDKIIDKSEGRRRADDNENAGRFENVWLARYGGFTKKTPTCYKYTSQVG